MDELEPQAPDSQTFVEYPRAAATGDTTQVERAVAAYKKSSLATMVYVGIMGLYAILMSAGQQEPTIAAVFGLLILVAFLAFIVLAIMASTAAAETLGTNKTLAALITGLLVLVPCGALIALVSQQTRMSKVLKAAGIRVGFTGPNKEDVARVIGYRT